MGFLNTNNILYRHQCDFRRNYSTIHPIIHLLNNCAEAASKSPPEYTIASLFELSKVFDVINHDILLNKLHRYGMKGTVNEWLKVIYQVGCNMSSSLPVCFGVPQDSMLGPLLYLIYVNDIENYCQCNILSFADDITLYVSHSNINTLFSLQMNN